MKIEGYEVEQLAPGVKVYKRQNAPHTTYEETCPWIHFHYAKNDDEAERDGSTEVELCCHGCGVSLWVTLPFPAPDAIVEQTTGIRADFKRNHEAHNAIYVEGEMGFVTELTKVLKGHPLTFLCPDFRRQSYSITLR